MPLPDRSDFFQNSSYVIRPHRAPRLSALPMIVKDAGEIDILPLSHSLTKRVASVSVFQSNQCDKNTNRRFEWRKVQLQR
jgi:hypothetical protein